MSGRAGRLVIPAMIVTVAIAAVYVAGASNVPGPSPASSLVGVASPAPTATSAPSPTIRPIVTPAPTIEPTPPPPWQWTRSEFDLQVSLADVGAWGVGDHVLVVVHESGRRRDPWAMARLTVSRAPEIFEMPAGIGDLTGGSVIGDELWFLARFGDRDSLEGQWRLLGTADGRSWERKLVAEGLGNVGSASFVGRVGGNWVAALWPQTSGGVGTPVPQDLVWSGDGMEWRTTTLPDHAGTLFFPGAAMLGDTMVVLGEDWVDFDDVRYFSLTSTDGRTWQKSRLLPTRTGWPDGLVCGQDRCVLTLVPYDFEQPTSTQTLFVSSDGERWSELSVDVPYVNESSQLTQMRATSSGFIATTGLESPIWQSDTGLSSWRSLDVLPPDSTVFFQEFAAARDLVIGIYDESSDLPIEIWTGSLSAMAAELR